MVSKSFKQKLCLSILVNILYLLCHIVTRFVYFRAKGARARVHFPATYFQYFVPRFPHSFLFCRERKNSLNAKTFSNVRAQACLLRFIGLSVEKTAKKLEISECWAVKWSSSNEGLEDKKRRGKLIVLNKEAKIGLKKVRCKKNHPTR